MKSIATTRNRGLIARTSACIEGEFYGRLTRVEETIEFIKRMGYKKDRHRVLRRSDARGFHLRPHSQGKGHRIFHGRLQGRCTGQDRDWRAEREKKLNGGCGHESMCNPIMQAKTLAAHGCDFNIVIGLCVGHDTLFLRHSKVPTTVMIVKDRVLQHNPVAALYGVQSMYSRFKDLGL